MRGWMRAGIRGVVAVLVVASGLLAGPGAASAVSFPICRARSERRPGPTCRCSVPVRSGSRSPGGRPRADRAGRSAHAAGEVSPVDQRAADGRIDDDRESTAGRERDLPDGRTRRCRDDRAGDLASDPDDGIDPASLTITVPPAHGAASFDATGLHYTPNADFVQDQLQFKVCAPVLLIGHPPNVSRGPRARGARRAG